jgi:hypothetical protein
MTDLVIGYIAPAAIGALSGYVINQLPPIRSFRESRGLLLILVVEMTLGLACIVWLKENPSGTERKIVEFFGYSLLGAFILTFAQVVWRLVQQQWSARHATTSLGSEAQTDNPRVVVKGTKMRGQRNTIRVSQPNVLMEDTDVDGIDQNVLIDDRSSSHESSKGS